MQWEKGKEYGGNDDNFISRRRFRDMYDAEKLSGNGELYGGNGQWWQGSLQEIQRRELWTGSAGFDDSLYQRDGCAAIYKEGKCGSGDYPFCQGHGFW